MYTESSCLLKDKPYNGQIYLESNGMERSTGILKIYLDGKYMPLCAEGVCPQAINSACRQLGYTNFAKKQVTEK